VAFIAGPWKLIVERIQHSFCFLPGFRPSVRRGFYGWLATRLAAPSFPDDGAELFDRHRILTLLRTTPGCSCAIFRFLIGIGVEAVLRGPSLVQEFVPPSKRGMVGAWYRGRPVGVLMGAAPRRVRDSYVGWRGLFANWYVPAYSRFDPGEGAGFTRWADPDGRTERRAVAGMALEMDPAAFARAAPEGQKSRMSRLSEFSRYPRARRSPGSQIWRANRHYGLTLWFPLCWCNSVVTPARASSCYLCDLAGLFGRVGLFICRTRSAEGFRRHRHFRCGNPRLWQRFTMTSFSERYLCSGDIDCEQRFCRRGSRMLAVLREVWPVALATTGDGLGHGLAPR